MLPHAFVKITLFFPVRIVAKADLIEEIDELREPAKTTSNLNQGFYNLSLIS